MWCIVVSYRPVKKKKENLETLTEALDFRIRSRETLDMIPNLKKLGISWRDESEFVLDNVIYLQNLEILKIRRFELFGGSMGVYETCWLALLYLTQPSKYNTNKRTWGIIHCNFVLCEASRYA